MNQKIKVTIRKFRKTAMVVSVALFIAGVAYAQSKQSDTVNQILSSKKKILWRNV